MNSRRSFIHPKGTLLFFLALNLTHLGCSDSKSNPPPPPPPEFVGTWQSEETYNSIKTADRTQDSCAGIPVYENDINEKQVDLEIVNVSANGAVFIYEDLKKAAVILEILVGSVNDKGALAYTQQIQTNINEDIVLEFEPQGRILKSTSDTLSIKDEKLILDSKVTFTEQNIEQTEDVRQFTMVKISVDEITAQIGIVKACLNKP